MTTKRRIVLFGIAYLVWCLLNWLPDWQHLAIGVFVSAIVSYLTGDLFVQSPGKLKQIKRFWYFIAEYLPLFLTHWIAAAVEVSWRILHPSLKFNPGIVKVKTSLTSDVGLTFLANAITLASGTMTVDIDKEDSLLYVHWVDVKAKDAETATKMIAGRFETVLKKIFD